MVKRSQAKKRKKVQKLLETKSVTAESGETNAKSNNAADLVENALALVENGDLAGAKDLCKKARAGFYYFKNKIKIFEYFWLFSAIN
jgi:hypothetical protein